MKNLGARIIPVCFALALLLVGLTAYAAPPGGGTPNNSLMITEVQVNDPNNPTSITITGAGFSLPLEVTLGETGVLTILGAPTDTMIEAQLPPSITPGDYLLTVSTGSGQVQADSYGLTIGSPLFNGDHDNLTNVQSDQHHARYTDPEAVAAMGVLDNANPLNHDRYTDPEAVAAMGALANTNPLNHDRYTDAEAIAAVGPHTVDTTRSDADILNVMGPLANGNPYNHTRYTNAEAVAAMGLIGNTNPLNHNRYTDAEAINAVGPHYTDADAIAAVGDHFSGSHDDLSDVRTNQHHEAFTEPSPGNTGVGLGALASRTTGLFNTAVGIDALGNCATCTSSTALGFQALSHNDTGHDNTAIGTFALGDNTIGIENTATGMQALWNNTDGSGNTATGFQALATNNSGSYNTATGHLALQSSSTGNYNTASGYMAHFRNKTGDYNTAIGTKALSFSNDGVENTAVGAHALINTTGSYNTGVGRDALQDNVTGSYNTAVGYKARVAPSTADLINATAIGANAVVNADNKIRLGDTNVTVIEGQVGFTAVSDKNKKENFQPVDGEDVLRKLRDLPLTSWNFIGHDPAKFRHYGPMAQDFFKAFGHDSVGQIGSPTTITTTDMAGILMTAVQALERRTKSLKEKEAQLADLETRLAALEHRLGAQPAPVQSNLFGLTSGWPLIGGLILLGLIIGRRTKHPGA